MGSSLGQARESCDHMLAGENLASNVLDAKGMSSSMLGDLAI